MKLLLGMVGILISANLFAQIETYFNQNQSTHFKDVYRKIDRPGDDFEQIIVDQILGAKSRVWMAVQELNLPRIAHALAFKKSEGLDVRVVIENSYDYELSQYTTDQIALLNEDMRFKYQEFSLMADSYGNNNGTAEPSELKYADTINYLRTHGVTVINDKADGSAGSGLMHHKFVVLDEQKVLVGSNNYTTSCSFGDFADQNTRGNSNSMLKITDAKVNQIFAQEFLYLWGSTGVKPKFGTKKPFRPAQTVTLQSGEKITIIFSPFSSKIPWESTSNGLISQTLASATSSIKFALFVLSEQKFSDVMEEANARGVKVSGVIDPVFVYQYYSGALDMLGVERLSYRCEPQKDNKIWARPIKSVGMPRIPMGDKLHHKFGIVDNKIVIVGSHNWSDSANATNDETLLVIEDSKVAASYVTEYNRLASNTFWGLPNSVSAKIEAEKAECGQTLKQ